MTRALGGLAAGLIVLALSACDAPPERSAKRDPEPSVTGTSEAARKASFGTRPRDDRVDTPKEPATKTEDQTNTEKDKNPEIADPWLWLEDIDGTRALLWVMEHNRNTRQVLERDPRFNPFKDQSLALLTAPDRIPYGRYRNGYIYNFWQDQTHVRGIWRRTTLESYRGDSPEWETLLDVDKLAAEEGENWVLSGISCLPPAYEHCMVALSRGGQDRFVLREWNAATRTFVEDGFRLDESYSEIAWLDRDTLLISSPRGRNMITAVLLGYRDNVRKWKRGTPVSEAEPVFEAKPGDKNVSPGVVHRPEGTVTVIARQYNFYDSTYVILRGDGTPVELPLPRHADLAAVFKGRMLFVLNKPWKFSREDGDSREIQQGALIAFDLDAFLKTGNLPEIKTIYVPDERSTISGVSTTRDAILLSSLNNVASELSILHLENDEWKSQPVDIPKDGTASVVSTDDFADLAFFAFENYLTPDSLFQLDMESGKLELLKSLPPRFNSDGLTVKRFEATSRDGTKVPWTLIEPDGAKRDGNLPVLLYGYGGFGITLTPQYWAEIGKLWLEKGGAFAVANIRGGGAFGPDWHQAGLKLNRQRGFDDFIGVAEDMIERKITNPRRLGIMGGSNGGLLVGVAFTQRPELYNAVICQVPLLDMIRYTKLGPGRIWISEYGDPDVAKDRKVLLGYSPYHNLKRDADYPKVFFLTSTNDDRVHPGHARKMAARMEEMGHDIHYYEYFEGGHSANANLHQRADIMALQFVYLAQQLMDNPEAPARTAQPNNRNPLGDTGN